MTRFERLERLKRIAIGVYLFVALTIYILELIGIMPLLSAFMGWILVSAFIQSIATAKFAQYIDDKAKGEK